MNSSPTFKGRTLIYSNRPPTAGSSGGAQVVIEASNPTWWVGPKSVPDKFWNVMDINERTTHTLHGDKNPEEKPGYDVQTFPVPKSLEEQQYRIISNEILWPIAHSMQPTTGSKTVEELEAAYYEGYVPHNELANVTLRSMVKDYQLSADDRIWVHDYQCDNVPGMLYSRHIPWPTVDFLETVSFPSEKGTAFPLLQTGFFRDFMELAGNRALSTFQRPVDQANFIMTAALVAGSPEHFSLESSHPALQNLTEDVRDPAKREAIQHALLEEIGIGSVTRLRMFGANTSVMNVPVGLMTEHTYEQAIANENALDKTRFETDGHGHFSIFSASLGDGEKANLTACNPQDFDKHRPPLLSDLVEPIRERDWIFSVHRNDYTKGTMTKLEAADKVLAENPNATFLFILQPTREDVSGYREYAKDVFNKAKELREKYDDKSIVIIPEGVKHDDILGLMRQPQMRGFMGLGHKDGHDLTVREFIDSNDSRPLGVITSAGIGASDVLGDGDKGAFVIQNPTDAQEVANALRTILAPQNAAMLTERFDFMKIRSKQYDAANFCRQIDAAYAPAMAHRLGENWRETFTQPNGVFFDRNGEQRDPEAELSTAEANLGEFTGEMREKRQTAIEENKGRPKYIKDILEGQITPNHGIQR